MVRSLSVSGSGLSVVRFVPWYRAPGEKLRSGFRDPSPRPNSHKVGYTVEAAEAEEAEGANTNDAAEAAAVRTRTQPVARIEATMEGRPPVGGGAARAWEKQLGRPAAALAA